ncbi:MAG: bifunctional DNA-formamidopyrimidine glycosylase/DNA-(apurinic or apyrimidinic site) lyase, partial [Actinobacteria bacterium]|nr:bifunctional DNA-formamidopyrimidine glycosylase/DNA-(apurinic or apyrimidinic site) lyase [Actinomycetota bacterium]
MARSSARAKDDPRNWPSRLPLRRRSPGSRWSVPPAPPAPTTSRMSSEMPELPEVETIRRELEKEVVGKKIKTVVVTGKRTIRRQKPAEFVAGLEGAKITGSQRKGKYLLLALDTGSVLVIHLRMSGQLLRAVPKDPEPKHTHVTITFTQGGLLRFVDPRTFGEMFLATPDEITTEIEELSTLGVDPVETPMSWVDFGHLLRSKNMKLKTFLTDQSMIAGIGNIYSDEILFDSGLRFDRETSSLTTQEIRRLYRSLVEILHEACKYNGSTLADAQYVDIFGKAGTYQEHHQVYDRDKQPCRRCRRGDIQKV